MNIYENYISDSTTKTIENIWIWISSPSKVKEKKESPNFYNLKNNFFILYHVKVMNGYYLMQ